MSAKIKGGRPAALTPEQTQVIREARAAGAAARDIAAELGVSLRTVQRALAGAPGPYSGTGLAAPPPAAAPYVGYAAPEPEPDAAPVLAELGAASDATGRDPLELASAAAARVDAVAENELAAGNIAAYTALLRQQTLLITAIRQLEAQRANADRRDGVFFTHEQLVNGAKAVAERLAAEAEHRRAHGGLTCCRCGEELRMLDAFEGAPPNVEGQGS